MLGTVTVVLGILMAALTAVLIFPTAVLVILAVEPVSHTVDHTAVLVKAMEAPAETFASLFASSTRQHRSLGFPFTTSD